MPKPKHHVFICINKRPDGHPKGCCQEKNSINVWQKFAEIVDKNQAFATVKLSGVQSCLGPCQAGPVVIVHPDNVWYKIGSDSDIEEIFDNHLMGDKPVERLMLPEEIIG